MRKAKIELTADTIRKAIEDGKAASMTQLAHQLGYKGSVSSSLTRKFRQLVQDIDGLLAANKPAGGPAAVAKPKADKLAAPAGSARKSAKGKPAKQPAKPAKSAKKGKWPHDPRNVFRQGSAYSICYDILAAHPEGLTRENLVKLLAKNTGKDIQHAGYDAQVLLSARGNEPGLSRNDGPRHRSCRPGFWIERVNSHVKLVVD